MKAIKMVQKLNSRIAGSVAGVAAMMLASSVSAAGLEKPKQMIKLLQSELTLIVPIMAAVSLLVLGLAYANKLIQKDTLVTWVIGVIISGSASEIVALIWG